MATTLDKNGNVLQDGYSTNLSPTEYNTISSSSLAPQKQVTIPAPTTDTTNYNGIIAPITQGIADSYTTTNQQYQDLLRQQQQAGQEQVDLMARLTGRTADLQTAQDQAGVNAEAENLRKYTEQLANINAQASSLNREAQAIPIANRLAYKGTAGTENQVQNVNYDQLQQNALKALSLGQQADIASASATGSQLRLNAAKEKAQQIVDLKYKPLEDQLAIKKQVYELNKDILTSVDKKRAETLNIALQKEQRDLEEKKANEKAISEIGVTLGKYGADQSTIQDVLSSKNINDAIIKAGSKLQDPRAKMELESIRIDQLIKRAELAKIQRATALLGQPTQDEKKVQATALKNVKAQIPALEDKMVLLDGVLSSNAIDSVVGPTFLSRAGGDIAGIAGRFVAGATAGAIAGAPLAGVGAIPGAIIGGTALASQGLSDVFGSRQSLISSVNQFTDKAFLDELLSLKERGGTLGQVTEKEGQALRSAASKIGTWEIKNDKGQVIGYNASEKDFKDEINRIRTSTNRILTELRGSQYSAEEQQLLDEIYNSPLNTNASDYFQ